MIVTKAEKYGLILEINACIKPKVKPTIRFLETTITPTRNLIVGKIIRSKIGDDLRDRNIAGIKATLIKMHSDKKYYLYFMYFLHDLEYMTKLKEYFDHIGFSYSEDFKTIDADALIVDAEEFLEFFL